MVRILLEAGIDPNSIIDESTQPDVGMCSRETPLLVAIETKHVPLLQLLIDYGASVNLAAGGGIKKTPLQKAAQLGCLEVVQFLLRCGARVNAPPAHRGGATALQFAAIQGFGGIVELLLQNGADVNAPGANILGRTALEGAAEDGRVDTVRILLEAGACREMDQIEQYESSVQFATKNGHVHVVELLNAYDPRREMRTAKD